MRRRRLTAGAPTLTAVAELVPFLGTDTAAAFTAGAPTLAASAEKVRVFVTAAVITAGAPDPYGKRGKGRAGPGVPRYLCS